ncbi:amino acid kinase family-domain-containing protein [Mycotypha africana]|uniref:amino acid kinase family-domain-containing protein n=1 Tax=Mycotypha africana TaxID=64632 RepID=UPI002301CE02|nr:amino acid kinase family-domain-containing protein [Mycotypha africana]KAI8992167.1 amino acid kinase family-domain-containing protein [Mycotypha africana]
MKECSSDHPKSPETNFSALPFSTHSSSGRIVIVKLGGAAITNKSGLCDFPVDEERDNHTYSQIALAYKKLLEKGFKLILVHGAGSFGHPQAKEYRLKDGWAANSFSSTVTSSYIKDTSTLKPPSSFYRKGFSYIRCCLQKLNHHVVDQLQKHDVPVLSIPPIDYIEELSDYNGEHEDVTDQVFIPIIKRVQKYLKLGFVPVLHGDAVFDRVRGCTILSGDAIIYQLAKHIPEVQRCVFLTDVDGVFKYDPKIVKEENENVLYHLITVEEDETSKSVRVFDVTGGMDGKIRCAKQISLIKRIYSQQEQLSKQWVETVICRIGSVAAYQMMTLTDIDLSCENQQKMTVFTV